jgi:hypothetical protein
MMVTTVPGVPEVGVNLLIAGVPAFWAVKLVALVALPPWVVTMILPVVAPTGTRTLIAVEESLTITPDLPLKVTVMAPEKWAPVMVTIVPGVPDGGVNLVMVGMGTTHAAELVEPEFGFTVPAGHGVAAVAPVVET